MKFNKIILMAFILLTFLTISVVSATDNNTDELISTDDSYELSVEQVDEIPIQNSENNQTIQTSVTDNGRLTVPTANTVEAESNTFDYPDYKFGMANNSDELLKDNLNDEYMDGYYETYAVLKITKLITYYNSGKTFNVKVVDGYDTSKPLKNVGVEIYVDSGKNFKIFYATTNSNGIAKFKLSALSIGTHNVQVVVIDDDIVCKAASSTVKIIKANAKVSAPAVAVNKGESKYFKVTVKNPNGLPVKYLKLKLNFVSGKKIKTFTVKTNAKGVAYFKTNKLSIGNHKVIITSSNKNYNVGSTSKIIVKQKKTVAKKSNIITVKKGKFKASFTIKIWNEAKISPGMWDKKIKNTGIKTYNGKTIGACIYTYGNDIGVSWNAGGQILADKYLGTTSVRYQDLQ